jgi:hypothetical protein
MNQRERRHAMHMRSVRSALAITPVEKSVHILYRSHLYFNKRNSLRVVSASCEKIYPYYYLTNSK